jgi:hypothetical protein
MLQRPDKFKTRVNVRIRKSFDFHNSAVSCLSAHFTSYLRVNFPLSIIIVTISIASIAEQQ